VKEKIIYVLSFLMAFVLVTGLLIFLNSTYKNIFAFDFSSPGQTVSKTKEQSQKDSTKVEQNVPETEGVTLQNTAEPKIDSALAKKDEVKVKDSVAVPPVSENNLAEEKKPDPKVLQAGPSEAEKIAKTKNEIAKRDSLHNEWVKNTAKLYESMDTQKAAKIILGYSDNIARDLLLMMKKKKAAEILAEFKPETATRIISAVQ